MMTSRRRTGGAVCPLARRGWRASSAGSTSVAAPAATMNLRRENLTITGRLLLLIDAVTKVGAEGHAHQQVAQVLPRLREAVRQRRQRARVGLLLGVSGGEAE